MTSSLDFSPEWNGFRRWYWIVAALLALLLLLLWFTGFGPGGSKCKQAMAGYCADNAPVISVPSPVTAPVTAPVVAAPAAAVAPALVVAAPAAVAAAPAAVALPTAVIYFAKDKADMPIGADQKLVDVAAYLTANVNAKAVLSGFHDPSGNLAHNEELALNRARSVRASLEAAGIVKDRVVMQKPAVTAGGGAPEEARRVEVSVRPE
jgi:K(+)-stimulated pyrophosphate-energized sodium pump